MTTCLVIRINRILSVDLELMWFILECFGIKYYLKSSIPKGNNSTFCQNWVIGTNVKCYPVSFMAGIKLFFRKKKKKKKKTHLCFNNRYFLYTLLCEFCQNFLSFFSPKGNKSTKIEYFCSKRYQIHLKLNDKRLITIKLDILNFSNRWFFSHSHRT